MALSYAEFVASTICIEPASGGVVMPESPVLVFGAESSQAPTIADATSASILILIRTFIFVHCILAYPFWDKEKCFSLITAVSYPHLRYSYFSDRPHILGLT